MSQLGVFLARQELRVVFDNFDANKDGNIAYAEFVNVLRVSKRHSYSFNPLPSFPPTFSFVFPLTRASGKSSSQISSQV